ncbi:magnesium transporter CorA [Streptomyces sp. SID8375]|uniref:magnesium and cobalt transport protein CorA n=1 Tax=unclassified Streptomyces TaxID=2593676 RepID=UPI00036B036D|nr:MULTISPECIES: magnesium and cobalt transport protein CorA [unclassified Streptomyces]MYX09108.1 magnesium transporter CorA [Streptomyces sp. SID8375]
MPTARHFPTTQMSCVAYAAGVRLPAGGSAMETAQQARAHRRSFVWIALHEPTQEELSGVAALFNLHPLAVEDAFHAHQRPKLERYGETLLTVFKTIRHPPRKQHPIKAGQLTSGEVMVFTGPDFTVTVEHGDHGTSSSLQTELEAVPARMSDAPSAALHAIADRVVDDYLAVIETLHEDIEEIESEVFSHARGQTVQPARIYQLKREMLELARAVVPLEQPLQALSAQSFPAVPPQAQDYFRDVADRLLQVSEQVDTFSDLLNSILDADLAQVAVAQNADMRRISAWLALIALPTMVCGIYGMNFDHMPELHWRYGFPLILAGIVVACLLAYRAFRRSGWL